MGVGSVSNVPPSAANRQRGRGQGWRIMRDGRVAGRGTQVRSADSEASSWMVFFPLVGISKRKGNGGGGEGETRGERGGGESPIQIPMREGPSCLFYIISSVEKMHSVSNLCSREDGTTVSDRQDWVSSVQKAK